MKAPECVCKTPEECIRVALAIETLAYHDKNYLDSCLAKSDARISEADEENNERERNYDYLVKISWQHSKVEYSEATR